MTSEPSMTRTADPLPDPRFVPLLDGYRRFRGGRYPEERERYRRLAEHGQHPTAMVVACSDSRSGPEIVFDAAPGELFVVRNVAALVPHFEPDLHAHGASAALEFAVRSLEIPSILVMAHGRCGGIGTAMRQPDPGAPTDFLDAWVTELRELAAGLPPGDRATRARMLERSSVERSITNLRTFPWLAEREVSGALVLAGAWFDISLGELHLLGPEGWTRLRD